MSESPEIPVGDAATGMARNLLWRHSQDALGVRLPHDGSGWVIALAWARSYPEDWENGWCVGKQSVAKVRRWIAEAVAAGQLVARPDDPLPAAPPPAAAPIRHSTVYDPPTASPESEIRDVLSATFQLDVTLAAWPRVRPGLPRRMATKLRADVPQVTGPIVWRVARVAEDMLRVWAIAGPERVRRGATLRARRGGLDADWAGR